MEMPMSRADEIDSLLAELDTLSMADLLTEAARFKEQFALPMAPEQRKRYINAISAGIASTSVNTYLAELIRVNDRRVQNNVTIDGLHRRAEAMRKIMPERAAE